MVIKAAAVLGVFIFLHLWVAINGGEFRVFSLYLFIPGILLSVLFCMMNVYKIPQENQKHLLIWMLMSTLPTIILIQIVKFIGEHSFYPWYMGIWDIVIPLGIIGAQFVFKIWIKLSMKKSEET